MRGKPGTLLREASSGNPLRSTSSEGQGGSCRGRWNSPATRPLRIGHSAELKNTLCLTRGKDAFLSQHVGDLKNLETFEFFQNMATHLGGLLEVKPEAIVCDLHPDYLSTSYALDSGLPVLRLQHHFAHVYGVLAENGHDAPALGLALDGTGYGTDGTIWGGELLFVDPKSASEERYGGRIGRLAPFPLPGARPPSGNRGAL